MCRAAHCDSGGIGSGFDPPGWDGEYCAVGGLWFGSASDGLELTMSTATKNSTGPLNKYSSRITQPASQGASQAMLIATGLSWEDLNKPQVGIGSVWYEGNPCNMHLAELG